MGKSACHFLQGSVGVQQAVTTAEVFPPAALTRVEGNTGEGGIEPPVDSTSEFK